MQEGHFSPDIEELLLALDRHQVRLLIVGGEAVIFYGHPRLTGDLDIYVDSSGENTKRLYQALEEFWGGTVPGISEEAEQGSRRSEVSPAVRRVGSRIWRKIADGCAGWVLDRTPLIVGQYGRCYVEVCR